MESFWGFLSLCCVFRMNPAPRRALVRVWDSGLKTLGSLVKDGRVRRERVEPVSAHSQPCLGLSGFMPW